MQINNEVMSKFRKAAELGHVAASKVCEDQDMYAPASSEVCSGDITIADDGETLASSL